MKRLHGKKGFTLVELIVVLTIVGVMLTGSVMGVGAYIDYSNFRSNNDCAYSLFMTIQSALAQKKASGELEQIKNSAGWGAPITLTTGKSTGREVQSLIISNGDLATNQGQLLLDIAGDYIYDKNMLDASILVELDINEGTLYSVAYSKQAADFSYESGSSTEPNGTVSVAFVNRASSIRRDTMLGYYSSDLPDPVPVSLGKPKISYVMLTNGETLDLSWRMGGRYRINTGNLVYTVKLTDAAGTELASFKINDNDNKLTTGSIVTCNVKFKGAEDTKPIKFWAYINAANEVHVALDKVDLSAAGQPDDYDYNNTQSVKRLSSNWGGYVGDIRATVFASGEKVADSDAKTSTAENLMFGSPKTGADNTIQNARHLFNLRFAEEPADPSTPVIFKQTASFAWGGSDGIIAHGNVANRSVASVPEGTAFPSIPSFASGNVLEGSENIKIDYLILKGEINENGIALFTENNGDIKKVTFANATVNAPQSDITAVVCGVNHGSLVDVTVEKTCEVVGRDYVGGIAGYDDSITEKTRSGLENAAKVTGSSYVGGIFGATKRPDSGSGDSGILECVNTGAIRSSSDAGSFIGGITGFNSGRTLNKCTSTPAGELSKVANATDLKGKFVGGIVGMQKNGTLKECNTDGGLVVGGEYVGGIIGLNAEANLSGLTGTTKSHNRADVAGKKYVGGIAGANVAATINIDSSEKTIIGAINKQKVIVADVTGIGVVAENGTWPEPQNNILLNNWTNEGVAVANDSYAGGIVGFNSGKIQECSSNVDVSSTSGSARLTALKELASSENKMGRLADFVGGIAGANVNEITAPTDNSRFVCVTAGRDYVGGIVGYNAPGGSVKNYKVDDAYVYGRCFVGGLMGLNCEAKIYGENSTVNTIEAHPSRIEGEYFVGGIMGGSIIASDNDVKLHCIANNYLGSVTSETGAGVGGIIGYNAMLDKSEDCFELAKKLTAKLDDWLAVPQYKPNPTSRDYLDDLKKITRLFVNDIDGMDVNNTEDDGAPARNRDQLPETSENKFIIEPIDNSSPYKLNIEFSKVSGLLYTGGAIGYNCKDTILEAKNVVNYSSIVSSTGAVEEIKDAEEEDWRNVANPRSGEETFSYAGGIVGRVTQRMRIENCANDSIANVRCVGTYNGLLAEVNEGVIASCTTIGTDSPGKNNLGGIAGLNRYVDDGDDGDNTPTTSGYIVDCSLTGDLRGGKGVGGIAAVNRGLIANCSVGTSEGITIEGSEAVGAIAAQNDGTIKDCTVAENTVIEGDKNVGGVVGENGGNISECTVNAAIIGDENVGGFAGYQKSTDSANVVVQNLTNTSTLTGKNCVGGIIGKADGKFTLKNCTNTKLISATADNGYAGGILAYNDNAETVIDNCTNTADVSAPAGTAGGISGYCNGTVKDCFVTGSDSKVLNVSAGKNSGGIVGESDGNINDCELKHVKVTGVSGVTGSNVGGVVGLNKGLVGVAEAENLLVTGAANGGALGGIAGQNRGSVTGDTTRTPFNVTVTLDTQFAGYTGGIVGWNRGEGQTPAKIENYTFEGKVSAGGSSLYGYGGVAGVNGDPDSLTNIALIDNCRVDSVVNYKVSADKLNDLDLSDATDADCTVLTTVNADVCVGGIAGLNCQNSTVSNSTLDSCYIRGYYGYVGGIVGHNKGEVKDCKAETANDTIIKGKTSGNTIKDTGFLVKVYMYNGDLGGLVGRTGRTATVKDSATGHDWAVLVTRIDDNHSTEGTDDTCAGVIGYNASDKNISGLENFARVRKRNIESDKGNCITGAGIIGRQENVTGSAWRIDSCKNYGNVETGHRAGGIIGQWKYNGGTVINCENYGCIKAINGAGCGGIVGSTYGASAEQHYSITGCFNNGTITEKSNNPGGIIGEIRNTGKNVTVSVLDCVNTGTCTQGSGIIGQIQTKNIGAGTSVSVDRCINYSKNVFRSISESNPKTRGSFGVPMGVELGINSDTSKLNFWLKQQSGDDIAVVTSLKDVVIMGVKYNSENEKYEAKGKVRIGVNETLYTIDELSLDPNAAANVDKPYDNYLAINDQLVAFIKTLYSGAPETPQNLNVETSDGAYLATWDEVANAYQYDVTVDVGYESNGHFIALSGTTEQNYTVLENSLSFAVDKEYEGKGYKIRVCVVMKNGEDQSSAPAEFILDVKTSLVMPKVQYEMTYEGGSLMFRARLLNYDEYLLAYGLDALSGIKIESYFTQNNSVINTTKKEFYVANKQSEKFDFKDSKSDSVYIMAQATGVGYINSPVFSMQTQLFGKNKMTTGTMFSEMSGVPFFTGVRPDGLACNLSLVERDGEPDIYRRTELVVTNADGVEVAIAQSKNDRISNTHNLTMDLMTKLAGGQNYTVRSYPWGTQGVLDGSKYISGCAYGHIVAENVTVASLTSLQDPWAPATTVYSASPAALTKGYVLSLNDDGTYNVYYSVLLASTDTPEDGKRQFIINSTTAPVAVDAPVLSPTYDDTSPDGRTKFSWTAAGNNKDSDIYEATVVATTFGDSVVNVDVPNGAIVNTSAGGELTLNLATSDYRSVKIAITRLGTEASGKTTKLGSTSDEVTYTIPRKLPALGRPEVELKEDRADVQYVVRWIPETGFAQTDTHGYTLWLAENEALTSPVALATPSTLTADTNTYTVDLEAYIGQPVWLYLTAHLKDSPINYSENSVNGEATSITVAGRIKLGARTAVTLSQEHVPTTAMTVESFRNSLNIQAVDPDNTVPGSFEMQAVILPDKPAAGGAPADLNGGLIVAWDGQTPVTKNMQPTAANSLREPSLNSFSETTDFSEDYAGMWVCARVRAASSSSELQHLVGSTWTEYKWMQLPRVQLDAPHSEVLPTPLYGEEETEYTILKGGAEDSEKLTLKQATLEWTWDKHAKDCIITIVGKDSAGTDATYGIKLSRDETRGIVSAINMSDNTEEYTATGTLMTGTVVASATTFTWQQTDSTATTPPQYGDTISYIDSNDCTRTVNVETRLTVKDELDANGNVITRCTLMLPDYDETTVNEKTRYATFNTKSVKLQYTALEARYADSMVATWAWDASGATTFGTKTYSFSKGVS